MTATRSDLFASRILPAYADRLARALATTPDPEVTCARAREVLQATAATSAARLERLLSERFAATVRVLAALCGSAPFLTPMLVRHPDWFLALAEDDLATPRSRDEYGQRLRTLLAATSADATTAALRQFKYQELARITVRELTPELVPLDAVGVPLAELSFLADTLLDGALGVAAGLLDEAHGPAAPVGARSPSPTARSGPTPGFVVLGLGKLGGEELNYSSDVDLVYVYDDGPRPDEAAGAVPPARSEHYTRLAQQLGRLVSAATSDGFLYRIDLDLRPEGGSGPLVVSTQTLLAYHEGWSAPWERAAYMKARPVAGDLVLGWRLIRALAPMIYRSSMDFETVAAIKDLRDRTERTHLSPGDPFNVKLGGGGIRDVESVVQALQLLHGGRVPEVRVRGTEAALEALAQVGILPADESTVLLDGYRFLRRVENRLQMAAERQTHQLPRESAEIRGLAHGLGFGGEDAAAAFEATLGVYRERIGVVVTALFHRQSRDRILDVFERRVPALLANPIIRTVLEELALRFAREIEAAPHPERALNNLDRFIDGVGTRTFYLQLLLDRPELVNRMTALFSASEYLSAYFARQPRLIEPIFHDPNVLLLSRREIEANFASVRREVAGDGSASEAELDALRLAHHREVLNVALLDLDRKVTRAEAESALSDVAEVCLNQGLAVARGQLERKLAAPPTTASIAFLVVSMGKLASRELTYGSDLDVIFLYDVADESISLDAQAYCVRLAQKLIWALRTPTETGFCYDIDARLRPSGNQGMLVTSLQAFERYHDTSAQVWERQALLRARPVTGSEAARVAFDRLRRTILQKPLPPDLGREIHRVRVRMETELARETLQRRNFKTGRGGTQDVETVVQFLQLRHGAAHPELFDVEPVAVHLGRLTRLGLLSPEHARTLTEGWAFLQHLAARLRIVENRSISDLDEERGDLDALARALGYERRGRASAARRALLDDYERHTETIRRVYGAVLGVDT